MDKQQASQFHVYLSLNSMSTYCIIKLKCSFSSTGLSLYFIFLIVKAQVGAF